MRGFLMLVALIATTACAAAQTASDPSLGPTDLRACVADADSVDALRACRAAANRACFETAGGETSGGAALCYARDEAAWSAMMDEAVARAARSERRRAKLEASQAAWAAWRDLDCAYQAGLYEGGSLARVVRAGCMADLASERAISLLWQEKIAD